MHPIKTSIKNVSPQEIYGLFSHLPYPILLESAMAHPEIGCYSFIAADPFLVFEIRDGQAFINELPEEGDPLLILKKLLEEFRLPRTDDLPPFTSGAAGYFSYDLGGLFEELPNQALNDIHLPEGMLCFYDTVAVVDHRKNTAALYASGFPEKTGFQQRQRAEMRLAGFDSLLKKRPQPEGDYQTSGAIRRHFDRDTYCCQVEKVRDYIRSGDVYQVNLTQRFSLPFSGSPFSLYRKLAAINPAPFAALFQWRDFAVVSASPERYLKIDGELVETMPIKGTRPRGKTPLEDDRLKNELWQSAKDRAELTMIVDLERNDLGRVSLPGSVRVPELLRLEQYATVWHLVSTVQGKLQPGRDLCDVLRASFPGGSITGAPKIRAMEIIEELEPVKRGIYTGSIGYLGFDGRSDLNIVIRTLIIKEGLAHIQVGGGITIDSDPDDEYMETLDKARALFRALGLADPNDGEETT